MQIKNKERNRIAWRAGRRGIVMLAVVLALSGAGGLWGCDSAKAEKNPVAGSNPLLPSDMAGGTVSVLKDAHVGDIVHFGTVTFTAYHGGAFGKDIGWKVLAVEDGKVLVITEDAIDLRPYNESLGNVTWEQCDLRKWLNEGFYQGLPQEVRNSIATTKVDNAGNGRESGGNDTADKVFLLSLEEKDTYIPLGGEAKAGVDVTDETVRWYKNANPASLRSWMENPERNGCFWWLRSPGSKTSEAVGVDSSGLVCGGIEVSYDARGVRPTLWLTVK